MSSNLEIVARLIEIAKNQLEYSTFPKQFKDEYIFIADVFTDSIKEHEREFDTAFQKAVGNYKSTLAQDGKGFGWFHSPEKLEWINMRINQMKYIVYGDRFTREIKFNKALGKDAYKDMIEQIDRTVLMSEEEKKAHYEHYCMLSKEIKAKILKEEK